MGKLTVNNEEMKMNNPVFNTMQADQNIMNNAFDPAQDPGVVRRHKKDDGKKNDMILPDMAFLSSVEMGEKYKEKLEKRERYEEMCSAGTELQKKYSHANAMNSINEEVTKERNNNMKNLMEKRETDCSLPIWNDLSWFVNTGDAVTDKSILDLYLGTGEKATQKDVGRDVHGALDLITEQLKNLDISGISLKNDDALVKNAKELEKITGMICAFDRLMGITPDYLEGLQDNDRAELADKCRALRSVAAFYVVRRRVITDAIYRKYKSEELSMEIQDRDLNTDEEKYDKQCRLSKDMIFSWVLGQKLLKENGRSADQTLSLNTEKAKEALKTATDDASDEEIKKMLRDFHEESDVKASEYMRDNGELYDQVVSELTAEELKTSLGNDSAAIEAVQKLRRNIQAMQAFLGNTMPSIYFDENGVLDKKNEESAREQIDSSCIIVSMLYNRLNDSLAECEKKLGGHPELKGMFTLMKEQNTRDSKIFREKVLEYRESAPADLSIDRIKDRKGRMMIKRKASTWLEALKYTRAEYYNLDEGGYTLNSAGGRSSDLLVIKKEGKKPVYFREEDKVPSGENEEIVDKLLKESGLSDKDMEECREGMLNALTRKDKMLKLSDTLNIENDKKTPPEIIEKKLALKVDGISLKYYNVDQQTKAKLGKLSYNLVLIFAKRMASSSKTSGVSALIRNGRNLSDRNVATSRLAAMLGIGSVISDSRTAVIRRNNKLFRGNLMEASGGITADECGRGVTYSNEAIGQLYALQIFDLICGQVDRNLSNYHVIVKGNKIVQIKGIDNDMAFGDLKFEDVKDGRNRIRALKKISILGMPKAMINRIMGMTPEYLKQTLGDILDEKELDCLWDRFDGVRKEISNISQNNSIMKSEICQ